MRLSTGALAAASARHPWRTMGAWVVALGLSVVVIATLLGGSLTTEGEPTNDPQAFRARDALLQAFPPMPGSTVTDIVVVRSEEHTAASPQFAAFVRELAEGSDTDALAGIDEAESRIVSEDGRALAVPIGIVDDGETEAVVAAVEEADADPALAVSVTRDETLDHDFNALSQEDLENGELRFGLPAAL